MKRKIKDHQKNLLTRCLLIFILFALSGNLAFGSVYSQNKKFTLELEDVTLQKVFETIEKQSEFIFFYQSDLMNFNKTVNVKAEDQRVEYILDQVLAGNGVSYEIIDRQIVLRKKGQSAEKQMETTESTEDAVLELKVPSEPQQHEVTGTVTDAQTGDPLPGVNIVVQGTTTGTTTDMDGEYSIEAPDDATLVFSFVGYQEVTVDIEGQQQINVEMEQAITELEEVVAVGYGTQKKANLTGSASSADMEQIGKQTASQASQLLQGTVSGITASTPDGKPGENQSSIKIRGLGTFSSAGTNPLVIVDGVPSSLNSVSPNNIESINVLKDAAASAIYGSRAANGVIIIQTKEGKAGEMKVTYESHIGKQKAAELPNKVDSWTYAEYRNKALNNIGKGDEYTQEDIEKFKSGEYPDEYPNKEHLRDFFNSGNGLKTNHNLAFSGGSDQTQYMVSTNYLKENGIVEEVNYDRYNMRINVNSEIKNNLTVNAKLFGNYSVRNEPTTAYEGTIRDFGQIMRWVNAFPNTVPGKKSDGTYGVHMQFPSPQGMREAPGFTKEKNHRFGNNISLEWNVIEPLKLTGRASYTMNRFKGREFGGALDDSQVAQGTTMGVSRLSVSTSSNEDLNLNLLADYDKSFGNHDLHILGGISHEIYNNEWMGAYRDQFPSTQLHVLDAASVSNDSNYGSGNTWKLMSYFGRINYSFQDKYLLEANLRYDGSSRFAEDNRFGLFPSMSAGWILSEESFFQIPWIENLKIRGSYGALGNQQIGLYPYQKTLDLGHAYPLGEKESLHSGVQLTTLPFQNITWESTYITNGGLDINLFEGKINLIVDYYYKRTTDILYNLTVANILGMSVSEQNAGEVENKGWEFELTYKDQIGDFSYNIRPTFSINHNEVVSLAGVEKDIAQGLFVGEPLSSIYGYETEGLFIDQEDIDNFAEQNYPAEPGLIRYKDISGPNGEPDGKITAEHDRKVIGNEFPKYSYGMGITANYKNFDLYLQLEGQGGFQKQLSNFQLPFWNQGNAEEWHIENSWTEENPDRNAEYPKLTPTSHGDGIPWGGIMNLEYWLRNASFLKINNVQIGYNIPVENAIFDQFRVYISGENIYNFDNYYEGYDPEMSYSSGYASYYPLVTYWSLGVNVQF